MLLVEWMSKNYPTVLEIWNDSLSGLIDLDIWLEEFYGWIDQEYQTYLGEEYEKEA